MNKPYVVSADIYLLMKEWATQCGFVLPHKEFFCQLRKEFLTHMNQIFRNFEFVSENEISQGIANLVNKGSLPTISLDRVYFKSELNLEITRLVNEKGKDMGLGHRAETLPLLKQIRKLQMSGLREVAIVDDVIFTGTLLERVINLLLKINIRVPIIYAGIGVAQGIQRINKKKHEIHCVRVYKEVVDETCERDFYPGVPLSGRPLIGGSNISLSYLLPFGNPEKWASIPSEHTVTFSKFCFHQTVLLFDEIERCSGKVVFCRDLGRKVFGLPIDETKYTKVLREIL